MSEQEYCIITDNDCHAYVCPAERAEEAHKIWDAITKYWDEGNYDDECPADPDFCDPIGGAISLVKFTKYRII